MTEPAAAAIHEEKFRVGMLCCQTSVSSAGLIQAQTAEAIHEEEEEEEEESIESRQSGSRMGRTRSTRNGRLSV